LRFAGSYRSATDEQMQHPVKKIATPPSQTMWMGPYFSSPVAGGATKGLQRQQGAHHRRTR
ncbi:hypothetical protein, partial [Nesterenkonia haasae]|uniref:hypothetical protein n=1 Tax=Nesterenkonia haasae TaxID=2587813 RepID=UPI001F187E52